MKRHVLRPILQCTWGLPQTLIGFTMFLILRLRRRPCRWVDGACAVGWHRRDGVSLGLFFFCPADDLPARSGLLPHEFGHTIQSLLLGPLYLLLVVLPSLCWCGLPVFQKYRRRTGVPYAKLYCEGWADRLGKHLR